MTSTDELLLITLKWIRTHATTDQKAHERDVAELLASDVEPMDVLNHMAAILSRSWVKNPGWQERLVKEIHELEILVAHEKEGLDG